MIRKTCRKLQEITVKEIYIEREVFVLILEHYFVMLLVLKGTGLQYLPEPTKINGDHTFKISTGLEV